MQHHEESQKLQDQITILEGTLADKQMVSETLQCEMTEMAASLKKTEDSLKESKAENVSMRQPKNKACSMGPTDPDFAVWVGIFFFFFFYF